MIDLQIKQRSLGGRLSRIEVGTAKRPADTQPGGAFRCSSQEPVEATSLSVKHPIWWVVPFRPRSWRDSLSCGNPSPGDSPQVVTRTAPNPPGLTTRHMPKRQSRQRSRSPAERPAEARGHVGHQVRVEAILRHLEACYGPRLPTPTYPGDVKNLVFERLQADKD